MQQTIESAMAPPDLAELLDDLVDFISQFLVLTPNQHTILALWVTHTYIAMHISFTPYLHIRSAEKRSGKSLLLVILSMLVAKPWLTSRTSAAALVRKVDEVHPTLLLDESDTAFNVGSEYSETLRGILNSGFHISGTSTVCVGSGANMSYRDFSTFCPKAIAGIGKLPDTVNDRSIPIDMKRKAPKEKVMRFRQTAQLPHAAKLIERLDAFAQITECYLKEVPLPEELDDRAQDIWEPLLQIADEAGSVWAARAKKSALSLSSGIEEISRFPSRILDHSAIVNRACCIATVARVSDS